ncbi:glyoxalase [Elizabethkingia ursingii]|uniref:VOC family protein n=1 Tax=Elizabethkingia ursingii TaxID=1756150 RepID=UPI00099A10AA|nr:VOC family protein [Elizabethkingia ursingii]OPC03552.1 glyoxalase [Elizabethkingia ursingii]
MSNKLTGFSRANHVGITVSNLEKSIAFYEALTGTKVSNIDEIGGERMAKTQGLKDTRIKYANLHLDNLNIDILEYVLPAPEKTSYQNNQISAMHLCFEVDDIDAAMERLKEIGVEPEGEPIVFQEEDGLKSGFGTAVAYFRDPDGTNLEIIAPQGPFKRKSN